MNAEDTATPLRMVIKRSCGFCMAAKRLLEGHGIAYEEIDVTMDAARHAELRRQTGWPTVPIVSVGDHVIGGYMELVSVHRSGELKTLLEA